MLISAVNKLTLVDYPGKLAAIIFTAGCNMRCGYCHNADFVLPDRIKKLTPHCIPFEAVEQFLKTRIGLLDAVVFCGGEPTMQNDLIEKMERVKSLGFLVKLDTNGLRPDLIQTALQKKVVDYIAMDIKTSLPKYSQLVGVSIQKSSLQESIRLIMNGGTQYEFRSTIIANHHDTDTLIEIGKMINGAKLWALQNFRNISTLDPAFREKQGFQEKQLQEFKTLLSPYAENIEVRM